MPPPFTSVTASVEWVRAEMRKGNLSAVEVLFRHDTGLTPEQRLALAKELVRDFRRHDPRSLGRIVLGLPPSEEADHLLWNLIATWSGEDRTALQSQLRGLVHHLGGLDVLKTRQLMMDLQGL